MAQHVLVVDDDEQIGAVLKAALEDEGYTVDVAKDGAAVGLAQTSHPALVLLDLMMPIMDGYEVGRRLRASPITADVPIIVMSASQGVKEGAARIGAVAYLAKPFNLETLMRTVATHARAS